MILCEFLLQYEQQKDLNHKEMAQLLGVSVSTYYRWLNGESLKLKNGTKAKLAEVLDCNIDKVLEESECFKPILGTVKAGYNLPAEQDIEGYLETGRTDAKKGDYFLRVTGDSMTGAHIYEGDYLFVKMCDSLESGQIGVVMVGEEVTVKRVYFKQDLMILEPANPVYASKFFTPEEVETLPVRILGKVIYVRRNFL